MSEATLPALHRGCFQCGAIMTSEEIEYLGALCSKCEEALVWDDGDEPPLPPTPRFEPWP